MDYAAWDEAIQTAIAALSDAQATSRSQKFVKAFPKALTRFRATLESTPLAIPLADFQRHPTSLLRWMLANWKDEGRKVLRTDLEEILALSAKAIQETQLWRSGEGECWSLWGFRDMEDMYHHLRTPRDLEARIDAWHPMQFCGLDTLNHPIHFELLPNTYEADLILPAAIRRIVNNEHTLRHRIPLLNPPPLSLDARVGKGGPWSRRQDILWNPILGATWIIDARRLSLWNSATIYKTASGLISHSREITSRHYPERGFRARVLNLGIVLGGMYNMAMALMPATTQASTLCFVRNDILVDADLLADWRAVPEMYRNQKLSVMTDSDRLKYQSDTAPFCQ